MSHDGYEFLWRIEGPGYSAECWRGDGVERVEVQRVASMGEAVALGNRLGQIVPLGDYAARLRGDALLVAARWTTGQPTAEVVLLSKGRVEVLDEVGSP